MKGIRKKINTGFLVLITLLMFSGMVSMFELGRMSKRTQTLLESSYYNLELSKRMLDAVERQNSSLLRMIVHPQDGYDQMLIEGRREFDDALREAAELEQVHTEIDSIVAANDRYRLSVALYFDEDFPTDASWFVDIYKDQYNRLTSAIKEYMVNSQYSLVSRATQIENNAYRAIMPGIITLMAAIIIVLVFMFMIDYYYTRPLTRLQKGLDGYLKYNIPFKVGIDGSDEIARIKDSVEGLISAAKKK